MKNKLLFYLLLLPILFTACSKDDKEPEFEFVEGQVPEEELVFTGKVGLLPSVWTFTTESFMPDYTETVRRSLEFQYDDKNRITSILEKGKREVTENPSDRTSTKLSTLENLSHTREYRLTYYKKGYLAKVMEYYNDVLSVVHTYSYEDDVIWVKQVNHGMGMPPVFKSRITLDQEGIVQLQTNATGDWKQAFIYDRNGNVEDYRDLIIRSGTWNIQTYDDKKGILSGTNTPDWYLKIQPYYKFYAYLQNNMLTETENLNGRAERALEYEYNEQGYPVSYRYPDRQTSKRTEEYTVEYIPALVF